MHPPLVATYSCSPSSVTVPVADWPVLDWMHALSE
jgi:hypothetical protein